MWIIPTKANSLMLIFLGILATCKKLPPTTKRAALMHDKVYERFIPEGSLFGWGS